MDVYSSGDQGGLQIYMWRLWVQGMASTETNICSVINKVFSGSLMGLGGVFGNWKGYMYLGTKGKWLGFWLVLS